MATCSVPSCDRESTGGPWCSTHYRRLNQKGDVLAHIPIAKRSATLEELFWPRVNKDGPDGCWIWTGTLNRKGYGATRIKERGVSAHRMAYELVVGPIPEGLTIDHVCRVKACVNPAHLEPVTRAENKRRASRLQTHCIAGHPLSGDNLYPNSKVRACIACARKRASDHYYNKKRDTA